MLRSGKIVLWLLAVALIILGITRGISAIAPTTPSVAANQPSMQTDPGNWPQLRYDVNGTADTNGAGINSTNVAKLTSSWTQTSPTLYASTPAVVGDTVYTTTNKSLYAYDLKTGKELWHYADVPAAPLETSSVAVDTATHMAYYGTSDVRVFAVNTETHQMVWNVQLSSDKEAYIWDSPLLVNGLLYIGISSVKDDPCIRGTIFALDPATGSIQWKYYAGDTLTVGIWASITANPAEQELLVDTGDCTNGVQNSLEDSVLALDWNSGKLLWQFRVQNHDNCDCDFAAGAVNFTYRGQPYVVAGSKYGVEYALRPPNSRGGEPTVVWSTRISGAGYLNTGAIYQPPAYRDGMIFVAGGPTTDGVCSAGAVWGLDATTGVPRWRHCTKEPEVLSNAISDDVLFIADAHAIIAYAAETGEELWSAPITGPVWGGIAIAHGSVLVGTVPGVLHAYRLPTAP